MNRNNMQTPPVTATNFVIRIAWNGPEDKPYYAALLISQSQAAHISAEPFVGHAILGVEEYQRVLGVLNMRGVAWSIGHYIDPQPAYFIETQTGDQMFSAGLGATKDTLETLKQVADALEPANRQPLQAIITRVTPVF